MTAPPRTLRSSAGILVQLGAELGRGGEGSVYEVIGRPGDAAKVYHKPITHEKATKIEVMAAMRTDGLAALTAWPSDLLRGAGGEPQGLLMPLVSGSNKDIHQLYGPRSRKASFPTADWRFLIHAASNTARAFASIHEAGCVIGDVNPGGIRVSPQATIKLIDCDSFQVVRANQRFLCEVGVPEFTPPELQGKPFRGVERSPNHDNFGLAILIFHLLFLGRHPFAGRFSGPGDMSIERAIAEFRFAFGTNRKQLNMEPPPNVPLLDIVMPRLGAMFDQAFSASSARSDGRPLASDWVSALEALQQQLKPCDSYSAHYFLSSLPACPWCSVEVTTGVVLFNVVVDPSIINDLPALWGRICAVQAPSAAAVAPRSPDQFQGLTPSASALSRTRAVRSRNIGTLFTGGSVLLLCKLAPGLTCFWVAGALIALLALQLIAFRSPRAISPFATQRVWRDALATWTVDSSPSPFDRKRQVLGDAYAGIQRQPVTRQAKMSRLEKERERQQLRRHLERHYIRTANIPGIGPGRQSMLQSYNIEVADDVTEANLRPVPGLGPVLTRALMEWRRSVERTFRFDPRQAVDAQEVAKIDRELDAERRPLERVLQAGPQELERIRNHIHTIAEARKCQAEEAAVRHAQAILDYRTATPGGVIGVAPVVGLAMGALGVGSSLMVGVLNGVGDLHLPSRADQAQETEVEPIVPPPAPTLPDARMKAISLPRPCDLWGRDSADQPVVLRSAAKGETFKVVAQDDASFQIVLPDGGRAWVTRGCAQ